MGMSASQARLLSITTRLTNNEFRAQTITNSKLRLAERSQEASAEYMDSLNTQKLMFGIFNDNGERTYTALTANTLFSYADLKSQYAMINSAGKVLVSSQDAKNFEETESLEGFLACYGLTDSTTPASEQYAKDKAKYDQELEKYNTAKAAFYAEDGPWQEYKKEVDRIDNEWNAAKTKIDDKYDEAIAKYNNIKSQPNLATKFQGLVGTSSQAIAVAPTVSSGDPKFCYAKALTGTPGCYLHLLNHLLDYDPTQVNSGGIIKGYTSKTFTTTTGESFNPGNGSVGGMREVPEFKEISDALNDTEFIRYCDGTDDLAGHPDDKFNSLENIRKAGQTPEEKDYLKSDYIEKIITKKDEDGNDIIEYDYKLKTLKEKAMDMYYIIQKGLITDAAEMQEMLINFTDGDMQKLMPDLPEKEPYPEKIYPEEPHFVQEKPTAPVPPENGTTLNDKSKAQWYTNLWYLMNGSETANVVEELEEKYTYGSDSITSIIFKVENAFKDSSKTNYAVLEDNLCSSPEWLNFALEHGIVTLSSAQFANPSVDSKKQAELTSVGYTWNSTIYTSAPDIVSQDDEKAIAIAEAKYKKELNEIEAKDKKYDQDLKKLDTEHTALQTEYDSIKEVISKNVERSFKAFS